MYQESSESHGYAATGGGMLTPVHMIMGLIIGIYLIEYVLMRWFGISAIASFFQTFSLFPGAIRQERFWTLFTYSYIHQAGSFLHSHIILNSIALFFIGRLVYPSLGRSRFFLIYTLAGVFGGGLWLLLQWLTKSNSYLIGASASICGIFIVLALSQSDLLLRIPLLGFVLKLETFAKIVVGIDVICLLLFELLPTGQPAVVAHSAHLGGYLAGWLYFRTLHHRNLSSSSAPQMEQPDWLRKVRNAPPLETTIYISDQEEMRQEVDRILDKIHRNGMESLTMEEKQTLHSAGKTFNDR